MSFKTSYISIMYITQHITHVTQHIHTDSRNSPEYLYFQDMASLDTLANNGYPVRGFFNWVTTALASYIFGLGFMTDVPCDEYYLG